MTISVLDELIEKAHARQQLPPPAKRREIRESANVSLREMAAAVGVTHATILSWEQGAQPRNPQHLKAYGRLLRELAT